MRPGVQYMKFCTDSGHLLKQLWPSTANPIIRTTCQIRLLFKILTHCCQQVENHNQVDHVDFYLWKRQFQLVDGQGDYREIDEASVDAIKYVEIEPSWVVIYPSLRASFSLIKPLAVALVVLTATMSTAIIVCFTCIDYRNTYQKIKESLHYKY